MLFMKLFIILLVVNTAVFSSTSDEINMALKNGRINQARTLVQQISQNSSEFKYKDFFNAQISLNSGELDKAEEFIVRALKNNPVAKVFSLAGGIYGMQAANASIFSKLGYAKKSKKNLLKAYELEPINKNYITGLLQFNMQAPSIVGGDSDQIIPLLNQLEKVDEKSAVQMHTIYLADEEGEDKALAYIDGKISGKPDVLYLQYYRAFLFENNENFEAAQNAYNQIIMSKPSDLVGDDYSSWSDALYRFGRIASIEEKWLQEGKKYFITYLQLESIKNSTSEAWANYRLGLIYLHLDDNENAKSSFQKARKSNPDKELKKRLNKI